MTNTGLMELKQRIMDEEGYVDIKPYSHNIIGLLLRQISEKYGKEEANKAIDECKLRKHGWRKEKVNG